MPNANALQRRQVDDGDLPALIVLGRDDSNKPHAAWFNGGEAEAAGAAARAMGMMALAVTGDEVRGLADRLPHGKVFASGRAFVPFTKPTTYDALIAHVPLAEQVRPLRVVRAVEEGEGEGDLMPNTPPAPNGGKAGTGHGGALSMPQDWSKVGPGCVVLAVADDKAEGWFEAVILKANGNSSYICRWRDYPDEPQFERPPVGIALLHPSRKATD